MTEFLQSLAARLAIPGLPDWVGLVLLLLVALAALAFLLMPFSVFGLKGRLDAVEAQLEELRLELRTLSLRLQEPVRQRASIAADEDWVEPPRVPPDASPLRSAPPVPPAAAWPESRATRAEPRLDWPTRR